MYRCGAPVVGRLPLGVSGGLLPPWLSPLLSLLRGGLVDLPVSLPGLDPPCVLLLGCGASLVCSLLGFSLVLAILSMLSPLFPFFSVPSLALLPPTLLVVGLFHCRSILLASLVRLLPGVNGILFF